MRRVVVTGIGLVTPLGSTVTDLFGNLMSGKSGIRRMSSDFSENLSVKIAAEANFDPSMHFS
ncbi:beta-ketoacyl-[acyl-carrier-protein] synthase family protein, partial [Patescibacteria group bacterium]